jgi:6-pyruvoyltetrahydropterin/6-carboxytetrahydropterin synthase
MFHISKQFTFSASHQLAHLSAGHPCAQLHGHNYRVEVVIESCGVGADGFILDYRALDGFKAYLDIRLDHKHIAGIDPHTGQVVAVAGLDDSVAAMKLLPATAERLALALYAAARDLYPSVNIAEMRVSETDRTWAVYRADADERPLTAPELRAMRTLMKGLVGAYSAGLEAQAAEGDAA